MVGKERLMEKMVNIYDSIADLDATVSRTCSKIYREALDILYGENLLNSAALRQ